MIIFLRLKINHDSHEFILEIGTVANMYICLNIYIYVSVSIYIYTRKMKLIKNSNFHLFAANGKQKFVFLGWQTINGNRDLLFQKMCPSMYCMYVCMCLIIYSCQFFKETVGTCWMYEVWTLNGHSRQVLLPEPKIHISAILKSSIERHGTKSGSFSWRKWYMSGGALEIMVKICQSSLWELMVTSINRHIWNVFFIYISG
jgi:hypothetical protein